jgi:hypothetical protein
LPPRANPTTVPRKRFLKERAFSKNGDFLEYSDNYEEIPGLFG